MAEQQSPRQQKDPPCQETFLLPPTLSWTANRRQSEKAKQPIEGEMGGKMRALPPIVPIYWAFSGRTVLFGFIIASQFSQSCLIVGEQREMITVSSMQTQWENYFSFHF